MLSINELKLGKIIKIEKQPYMIIWTQHVQMGRGGAILRTKIKNLITGSVLEKTFKGADKVEGAETIISKATYLYTNENEAFFMDSETYEQFTLDKENITEQLNFLIESQEVEILKFEDKPVGLLLPKKVKLKVKEAPIGVKGDSAQGATKQIILETGYKVNVPLFIKDTDSVIINTENGNYVERA